jgi:hypothetical protein
MSVIALATTHRAGALFADAVIDDYTMILPRDWCSEQPGPDLPVDANDADVAVPVGDAAQESPRRIRASA